MFGGNKDKPQRANVSVDTLISAKTRFEGKLTFAGGMHVDGTLIGTIHAAEGEDALIVLSDKGSIEGEVRAPHVILNGRMKGDVIATERLELAAQARVEGNIYYKVLEMAAGAEVNGRILRAESPLKALPAASTEVNSDNAKLELNGAEVSKLEVKATEKKSVEAKRA